MKRWLLWTFYCLRGRRCANLIPKRDEAVLPFGAVLHMNYTCGGCDTRYEAQFRWNGHRFIGSRKIV